MKTSALKKMLMLFALFPVLARPAWAAEPRLTLPDFSGLEGKASETVTITLDSAMLGLAARFLSSEDPDDAAVKELVKGLTGIYVKSFQFESDFVYPKSDVDNVRRQLSAPGWQRLVEVRSRKSSSDVDIYVSMDRDKVNGLAIIASEPRELTIVNIVGSVDLQKLHQLEGHLGVPKLQFEEGKKRGAE
ncbi:MAG: DUF4252 domain-containing protein [Gammaproteobacteria bacterium]